MNAFYGYFRKRSVRAVFLFRALKCFHYRVQQAAEPPRFRVSSNTYSDKINSFMNKNINIQCVESLTIHINFTPERPHTGIQNDKNVPIKSGKCERISRKKINGWVFACEMRNVVNLFYMCTVRWSQALRYVCFFLFLLSDMQVQNHKANSKYRIGYGLFFYNFSSIEKRF